MPESDQQRLARLLENVDWSPSDRQWLSEYLELPDDMELRELALALYRRDLRAGEKIAPEISERMQDRILAGTGQVQPRVGDAEKPILTKRKIFWYAAAAAAALLAVIFTVIRRPPENHLRIAASAPVTRDIAPGTNQAVLTLANGTSVSLSASATPVLVPQGGARVQADSVMLAYRAASERADAPPTYNTLTTPRGGQFRVVFSDGTRVWLNAGSSITYPTVFNGDQRRVRISGECYFEVAKDPAKPFLVETGDMEIRVLGTAFDVMSYREDAVTRATLVSGSIRVTSSGSGISQVVAPGEQAAIDRDGKLQILPGVDVDKAIAWKRGLFVFNNDDIHTIVEELSRWYNVEVVVRGTISQHFSGMIHRSVPVSEVFRVLQETGGIHFEIGPSKITVSP